MPLTRRDHEILRYCAASKAAPLSVLASRYFATHATTGEVNRDPLHACRRRIAELQKLGMLRPAVDRGPRSLISATPRAAAALGLTKPGTLPSNARAHHIATLEYIEILRKQYAERNIELRNVRLEFQLRAELQAGRKTRRGETFESFPDATFELVETRGGVEYIDEVAFEYVTQKYSDKDILEKHESFKRYDNQLWVSDKTSTAARVGVLTGRPSAVHA